MKYFMYVLMFKTKEKTSVLYCLAIYIMYCLIPFSTSPIFCPSLKKSVHFFYHSLSHSFFYALSLLLIWTFRNIENIEYTGIFAFLLAI